jgi:hypothetical protein
MRHSGGTGYSGTALQSSCNFWEHALVTLTNLQKK